VQHYFGAQHKQEGEESMARVSLKKTEVEARKRAIQAGAFVARVTVGGFVRDMRLAAGLSQKELAGGIGKPLSQTKVSQIEIGEFYGAEKVIERVLNYLASLKANEKNAGISRTNAKHMAALYYSGGRMEKI